MTFLRALVTATLAWLSTPTAMVVWTLWSAPCAKTVGTRAKWAAMRYGSGVAAGAGIGRIELAATDMTGSNPPPNKAPHRTRQRLQGFDAAAVKIVGVSTASAGAPVTASRCADGGRLTRMGNLARPNPISTNEGGLR